MSGENASAGRLSENVMHFARVLRGAGIPVGPDRVIDALKALEVAGIGQRDDFYWTLASVFLDRREQFELFDQAFHIFWRDPTMLERVMALIMPNLRGGTAPEEPSAPSRIAEAMRPRPRPQESSDEREPEQDAAHTVSAREVLQRADFETMTTAELAQAKKMIAHLRLPIPEVRTRRLTPNPRGRLVDMRASLRASLRAGADVIPLRRRSHAHRHPPLVVLCDISGSMKRYSRMFLHFLHAITNDRDRVHTLLFGMRLTNITRHLKQRAVDVAIARISTAVTDWAGGTRIGACLGEFNRRWSRRLLGQGAIVLLISDGLDSDIGDGLAQEMERLAKSCRRLIWLNPLLRYEGFEARPAGIRAMLPFVDDFLPVHNLQSLKQLATAFARRPAGRGLAAEPLRAA